MSLDKAILHGKERRKQYRDSKRFDASCRNHGGCSYCESGRLLYKRKGREIERYELLEMGKEDSEEDGGRASED